MKARLPKEYQNGGTSLQQLAKQAQEIQRNMQKASAELEEKEYSASSGGEAVKVIVTGKLELKEIVMKPEIVDPDDMEMLCDLIIAATNEALRNAQEEKEATMNAISGGLNVPGMF